MKPFSRPPRTPCKLSDSLHHQLNMYALVASAAGVGLLAAGQSAEAKVVYTPAHKWIPVNQYFYLDLNHDGVNDFRFFLTSNHVAPRISFAYDLRVEQADRAQSRNQIYSIASQDLICAAALPKGTKVGPKGPFRYSALSMFINFQGTDGGLYGCPWLRVTKSAYLGLQFSIKGRAHYGWARIGHISHWRPAKAELTGYAYETVPNKAIIAGKTKGPDVVTVQPDSLGRLALGRK